MHIQIGRVEFIQLFRLNSGRDLPGIHVDKSGAYVESGSAAAETPSHDLAFPCSVDEFRQFAVEHGLRDFVDAFAMHQLVERRSFEEAYSRLGEASAYGLAIVQKLSRVQRDIKNLISAEESRSSPDHSYLRGVSKAEALLKTCTPSLDILEFADGLESTRSKWPWGNHETSLLRQLADAATEHWSGYDPTQPKRTAPKNSTVSNWLMNKKVSKKLAEAMASILRADGLSPGPRGN